MNIDRWLSGCTFDPIPPVSQQPSLLTEHFLLDRLGAAPTVARVADFLGESQATTWRRLKDHQLQAIPGPGTTRINLGSLVAFLNGGTDYKRGKKAGGRQPTAQARRRVRDKQAAALQTSK
jgi:hypothetical protein